MAQRREQTRLVFEGDTSSRRFVFGDGLASTSSAASCARRRMTAGEVVAGRVVDGEKRRRAQSSTPSFLFFRNSRVMAQSRSQSKPMAVVHELKMHSAWASNLSPQALLHDLRLGTARLGEARVRLDVDARSYFCQAQVVRNTRRVPAVVVAHERRVLERLEHRGVVVGVQVQVAGERGQRLVEALEAREVRRRARYEYGTLYVNENE